MLHLRLRDKSRDAAKVVVQQNSLERCVATKMSGIFRKVLSSDSQLRTACAYAHGSKEVAPTKELIS